MRIGHYPDPCGNGLIRAYGYNTQKKCAWGLLSLTARVTKTGVAKASGKAGTLWRKASDGKPSIHAVLKEGSELTRNGSNPTIKLNYDVGSNPDTEKIDLRLVN